ncbi:8000_t:CDS:2, partial [Paraglomus occultum]
MNQTPTQNDSEGSEYNSDHENIENNGNYNGQRSSSVFITYPFVNAEPVNRQSANVDREKAETDNTTPSFPQPYLPFSTEQPIPAYYSDTFNSYRADANPTDNLQGSGTGHPVTDSQYEKWSPPPVYGGIESESGSGVGTGSVRKPAIVGNATKVGPNDPSDDTVIEIGDENTYRPRKVFQTDSQIRMAMVALSAFVRKVYFLLAAQLAVTVAISVWFMKHEAVHNFFMDILCILGNFFDRAPIFDLEEKELPIEYYFVDFIHVNTVVWSRNDSGKVVLQAFLITLGVFAALVLFTLQSKINFSSWGPYLYAGLWVVILTGIVGWLFPFDRGYHIAIAGFSALLFC